MRVLRTVAAVMLLVCFGLSGCAGETAQETTQTSQSTVINSESSSSARVYPKDTIVDPSVFDKLNKYINIDFKDKTVIESGEIGGRRFSLTVDLSGWAGNTTPEQIGVLSRLFWQVYPALYERFGKISDAPLDVVLLIEDSGYEIAEAWENKVHLHDKWLLNNPEDFDCITHELAHVIQNGWNGENLEYDGYIERFADYCRFIYCLDDGSYNDHSWTLQTVEDEPDRETSVRFLVWLDYNLSKPDRDFMKEYFSICSKGKYPTADWKKAWEELFKGTDFEGLSIDEVWKKYETSEFATLSSYADSGSTSQLLSKFDARKKAKALKG